MNLLIDVGNTRLKWCAAGLQGAISHAEPGQWLELEKQWRALGVPDQVAFGSVANENCVEQLLMLIHKLWPQRQPVRLFSQRDCCGVHIQYAEPMRFGVDRFAALVAARAACAAHPVVVIDAGTALTLDVLDAQGVHRGGWIMPGLRMMLHSLAHNTALLGEVAMQGVEQSCLPQSATLPAISSGVRCMLVGGVRQALEVAVECLGNTPQVLLCGGDAPMLLEHDPAAAAWLHQTNLVMDGLKLMLDWQSHAPKWPASDG